MIGTIQYVALAVFILVGCETETENLTIKLEIESNAPPVEHGVRKLKELDNSGDIHFDDENPDLIVKTAIDESRNDAEAYVIEVDNKTVKVTGGDEVGLMYGLLDIKEQLSQGNITIKSKKEFPHLAFRALKFNLPWDSYRNSEALDLHYETCRDTVFWESFLDMMAENRFNKLTLWNLHPFNYLVKTKKYPEATSFSDEEMKEWKTFWHKLFKMAKDRGIETYLVNWNIFVSPEFAEAHNVAKYSIEGKYIVDQGDTSEIIKDYTRESVREVIDTYPNLTGLGVTLGEGMGGMTAEEREEWILETVIQGARQAQRKIKFIHRVPLSAGKGSGGSTNASVEQMTRRTLDTLTVFDGPINIELKFNWSHAHSTPYLAKVHGGKLTDAYWNPLPENYKLAWMMRNEDFYILRWGQTDFIREHIKKNVHPYVNGYYVGSENYIPAKDYITSRDGASYKYAFERQWLFYKTWGRLLYNPTTSDAFFINTFEQRFPGNGKTLFSAQTKVSRVPLIIASYMNATWDFTLYSEGMLGFNDEPVVKLLSLETIANRTPMDPRYTNIKNYLDSGKKNSGEKITPIQLADSLYSFCNKALAEVQTTDSKENIDLLYEKSDIQAWSYLGLYFSHKLKAAVAYREYLNNKDKKHLNESISWLEKATIAWRKLVAITVPVYNPVPLTAKENYANGNLFHWSIVQEEVEAELKWLKEMKQLK